MMAIDKQKVAVSGAIAGAITPFLLQWAVMPVLNFLGGFVPQVSLKLAEAAATPTVAVNIRESLTGINGGFGSWLMDALGITVSNNLLTTAALGAVGGALLFVIGAMVADGLGFLSGNAMQKTRNTIFAGSILAALLLGTIGLPPEIGITLVNVLIALLINAAILAGVYTFLDKKASIGLVPY